MSRREFLGFDDEDQDREDRFAKLDGDRVITRAEFETAPGEDAPPQSAAYRAGFRLGYREGFGPR